MTKKRFFPRSCHTLSLVVLLLVLFGVAVPAELPPYVYKKWQEQAPESLIIKVQSVKTRVRGGPGRKVTDVFIEARVERVKRSKTGLKAGDLIRISYDHTEQGTLAGASEVPILEGGRVYPAFLKGDKKDEAYIPAAGGYTFYEVG